MPPRLDEDGREQRLVRLVLLVSLSVPPGTEEEALIAYFEEAGISWSAQCELVDWGYGA